MQKINAPRHNKVSGHILLANGIFENVGRKNGISVDL